MVEIKEAKNQTDIMGMTPCGKGKLVKLGKDTFEVQGNKYSGHVVPTVALYQMSNGFKTRIVYDGKQLQLYKYRSDSDINPFWNRLMSLREASVTEEYKQAALLLVEVYSIIHRH